MCASVISETGRKGESDWIHRGSLELPLNYVDKYFMLLVVWTQNILC